MGSSPITHSGKFATFSYKKKNMINNNNYNNNNNNNYNNKDCLLPNNKDNVVNIKETLIDKRIDENLEFPLSIDDVLFTLTLNPSIYKVNISNLITKMVIIKEKFSLNLLKLSQVLGYMGVKELIIFSVDDNIENMRVIKKDNGCLMWDMVEKYWSMLFYIWFFVLYFFLGVLFIFVVFVLVNVCFVDVLYCEDDGLKSLSPPDLMNDSESSESSSNDKSSESFSADESLKRSPREIYELDWYIDLLKDSLACTDEEDLGHINHLKAQIKDRKDDLEKLISLYQETEKEIKEINPRYEASYEFDWKKMYYIYVCKSLSRTLI